MAKRVGLSRSTVSQILNGNVSQFPQETRERVEAAAAELLYRPSRAGRALVTGVSDMVVVTFPSVTFGANFQDAVDQITEASATLGMSVVVRFAGRDNDATLTSVLDLRPMVVLDFGVFTLEQARMIEASGTRMLPRLLDAEHHYENDLDDYTGRLQVREAVRGGARHVIYAYLDDARSAPYGERRRQGVDAECATLGLPEPRAIRVQLDEKAAAAELTAALDVIGDVPVVVCAYNDNVAIAVMAAARRLGRSIPDEVGVIGVDHTAIGQLVTPRLTTVHVELPKLIDLLLSQLQSIRLDPKAPTPAPVTPFDVQQYVWMVTGDSC